jgi:hypothetical protein
MIVTIATHAPDAAAGLVAENLALLRARSGRKVLLMDATSRQACRQWAMERERLRLRLGPRLEARAVRGFGAHVQSGPAGPVRHRRKRARSGAARAMRHAQLRGARNGGRCGKYHPALPGAAVGGNRPGLSAIDIESSTGAAEMAALYEEVFQTACCQQ